MSHPYSEAYVDEVTETQGRLFERLQDEHPNEDGIDFIRNYMRSGTRRLLDHGEVYLATLPSGELKDYFLASDDYKMRPGKALRGFAPNWMGQFYARYQWMYGISSRELVEKVPPEWLREAYPGLHDLDLDLAVQKVAA